MRKGTELLTDSSSLPFDHRELLPQAATHRVASRDIWCDPPGTGQGNATHKIETPLAESSRRADWISPVNETIGNVR
jgi:hypothetical protein